MNSLWGDSVIELLDANEIKLFSAIKTQRLSILTGRILKRQNTHSNQVTAVDAFKALLQANATEYNAWAESMKGEAVKAQIYDTTVKAYASRVEAYKSVGMLNVEKAKIGLANNDAEIKRAQTEAAVYDSRVKGWASEVDGIAKIYGADAQMYSAHQRAKTDATDSYVKAKGVEADIYKTTATVSVEQAKARVQVLQEDVRLAVAQLDAAGKIHAQLAASAMSAFNLSWGWSSGTSYSRSLTNSLQESYSASV